MREMFLWEAGDEAVRPTQNPWQCPKCGIQLFTRSAIEGHKARCKDKPEKRKPRGIYVSPVTQKRYEIE